MLKTLHYDIVTVQPYINWLYFDYAWGVGGKAKDECERLHAEAERMLQQLNGRYKTHARFGLFCANSDGDDVIVFLSDVSLDGDDSSQHFPDADRKCVRLPMLRQQRLSSKESPNLCLSDFIRPLEKGKSDRIGIFATTVDHGLETDFTNDPFEQMLAQTLADRLAEATAELMHQKVRTNYWGYAPDERLSMDDLHAERFVGIRPAVGYPSLPDSSLNFLLADLIDFNAIGIRLTESGMMKPHASVSGLMIAHPQARYFDIGKIGSDQLADYALRRGIPEQMARRFLASSLIR